ncbi:MAG: hypothetical protein KTR30_20515 [Saprospiraceae bacterium]|nr:hypothetical protein [Saprospiraceae bacterium]
MQLLSITKLFGLLTLALTLGAGAAHEEIQCTINAKVVEVIPTGGGYVATSSSGAKVFYRPSKATDAIGLPSQETDKDGMVNFIVIESKGTHMRYQAQKAGFTPGAPSFAYVDLEHLSLELNVMRSQNVKAIQIKIRDAIDNKSLQQADQLLKEFEKFFPKYREIEGFKELKQLEIELREKRQSSSTLHPESMEDLQRMLREKELERIRTGNPDIEGRGNGFEVKTF